MQITFLADNLAVVTDCPHPARHQAVCGELAQAGIQSLLVVGDDPTPCPMGLQGGLWCYVLPLVDDGAPSDYEQQVITDFVSYERKHGRRVGIWTSSDKASSLVLEAACRTSTSDTTNRILPSATNSVCCRTYHPDGCDGRLACHAAPIEAAKQIMATGLILSKERLTGIATAELARAGSWGDPADYFEYVCLSRGQCVAPDIVAMSRQYLRDLSPQQADSDFYPGVRFFFQTAQLFRHERAEFDGIHPVKVRHNLELMPYLLAVVAPARLPDGSALELNVATPMAQKIILLDHHEFMGLSAWSTAAMNHAARMVGPADVLL